MGAGHYMSFQRKDAGAAQGCADCGAEDAKGAKKIFFMNAPIGPHLLLGLLLVIAGGVRADDAGQVLAARYQALRPQLENNAFGVPIAVESAEEDGLKRGEVHGVLAHPFAALAPALRAPREWCQIALLHLNIKTCTYERRNGQDWLTLYSGRKFYEPPEKAYALRYRFQVTAAGADYLAVTLTADSGPFGTRDYRLMFEAIPLGQQTFVHFRYAYRPSLTSSLATSGYLATLGSGKLGFTVTGRDGAGKPVYVSGVRGIVERNAMRYYLAIQAYLDTSEIPEMERFERRLARWFELTERYRAQLHELERAEYLQYKQQELRQQLERQHLLDAAAPAP